MRLILVRHGESEHGARGVIGGMRGCTGLTERGRAQAALLRGRLAAEGGWAGAPLLASPWPRARQTAEILAEVWQTAPQLDAALCELQPGEADGWSTAEYGRRYVHDLMADTARPFAPGGESWDAFSVRGKLETFTQDPAETIVAVTHSLWIVVSFLLLFGIEASPRRRARLDPDFCSLTEWRCADGQWTLVRYNDVQHLREARLSHREVRCMLARMAVADDEAR